VEARDADGAKAPAALIEARRIASFMLFRDCDDVRGEKCGKILLYLFVICLNHCESNLSDSSHVASVVMLVIGGNFF
jgi:hypothetical protein